MSRPKKKPEKCHTEQLKTNNNINSSETATKPNWVLIRSFSISNAAPTHTHMNASPSYAATSQQKPATETTIAKCSSDGNDKLINELSRSCL